MIRTDSRRPFASFKESDIDIFVETGTYLGGGVQDALDAGFQHVISYEISKGLYEKSRQRFGTHGNVDLLCKPSQTMYEELLKYPNQRMLFWLDGHYSFEDTAYHNITCPILEELRAISMHDRKDHVILVDDVRLFGTREFAGITLQQVMSAILHINPAYTFQLVNGHVPHDILVARVRM